MSISNFIHSLKPDSKNLKSDVVSGFATGLFSIPEGMAYAQLAGVNPLYGMYSGIVATIAASLSTGTILMISTLTSAIALSTASVLQSASIQDSQMPAALFTITFLVGTMMFLMGLLRLGSLVNYVSNAVMTGFVAGASILIVIGEMGDFTGYDPSGSNKLMEVVNWLVNIPQWNFLVTAVAVGTVILMLIFKRFEKTEKMSAIFTLFIMTIVVYVFQLDVPLVSSIATIPRGLPTPTLPAFDLIPKLALGSLSVALVALVQGAGISTAYPNPDGSRSNASNDFVGQGIGNLLGSFFQSMGTGGSLSRTGISVEAILDTICQYSERWDPCRVVVSLNPDAFWQPGPTGAFVGDCRDVVRDWWRIDRGPPTECQIGVYIFLGVECGWFINFCVGAVHPLAIHYFPGRGIIAASLYW